MAASDASAKANDPAEFRSKKTVLVATPRQETSVHLARILSKEGWALGLPRNRDAVHDVIRRGDLDLALASEDWLDDDTVALLRSTGPTKQGTPFAVLLEGMDEVVSLNWMCKGAGAFFHEPIAEVPETTLVFVLKSLFRTAQLEPIRVHEVDIQQATGRWMRLTVPSHQGALEAFQRFFAVLHASKLTEEEKRMLHLAINEIGMNAIEWGNQRDANRNIKIDYCFTPDRILVRIEDEGKGFNPGEVPDPTKDPGGVIQARKQQGKRLGGYGLALVNNIMDEVKFGERGNVVTMSKRLMLSAGELKPLPSTGEASSDAAPEVSAANADTAGDNAGAAS